MYGCLVNWPGRFYSDGRSCRLQSHGLQFSANLPGLFENVLPSQTGSSVKPRKPFSGLFRRFACQASEQLKHIGLTGGVKVTED